METSAIVLPGSHLLLAKKLDKVFLVAVVILTADRSQVFLSLIVIVAYGVVRGTQSIGRLESTLARQKPEIFAPQLLGEFLGPVWIVSSICKIWRLVRLHP